MPFTRLENTTKDGIKDWELVLFVPESPTIENPVSGTLNVQIALSDGNVESVPIDALLRLNDDTEGQEYLAVLDDMKNYIDTRLINELLPTP